MSTLKTINLVHPSSSNTNIVLDANGTVNVSTNLRVGGNVSFDNIDSVRIFEPAANTLTIHTASTERVRVDSTGNVGIGLSVPTAKLHVYDSSSATAYVQGSTGVFWTSASASLVYAGAYSNHPLAITTNNTERMRIDANGNVGIGTTAPGAKLQVSGASMSAQLTVASTDASMSRISLYNTNRLWTISNYGTSFSPNGGLAIADESGGAVRMIIDTSGNVGIGTPSPPALLSVNGGGQSSGSFNTSGSLGGTVLVGDTGGGVGNGGSILFSAAGTAWRFASIKGYVTDASSNSRGDIVFSTRFNSADATLTEVMRINSSGTGYGNVGIGTASPAYKLDVSGNANVSTNLRVGGNVSFDNIDSVRIFEPAANTLTIHTASTERVRVDSTGNVGIGTGSPQTPLDIVSPASSALGIQIRGRVSDNQGYIRFVDNAVAYAYAHIGSPGANSLTFLTNGFNERMRIDANGLVGIANTSPDQRLTINGSIRIADYGAIGPFTNTTGIVIHGGNNLAGNPTQSGIILRGNTGGAGGTASNGLEFYANGAQVMRAESGGNILINSGYGSAAIAYGVRIWANYTTTTVNASGGVTSVTLVSGTTYSINFNFTMVDANYSATATVRAAVSTYWSPCVVSQTTTACQIGVSGSAPSIGFIVVR